MSSLCRWSIVFLSSIAASAQTEKAPPSEVAGIPVNYDEAKVGTYTLPDPLVLANGKPVRDARTWTEKRRPEIVRLFEENQYGRSPGRPAGMTFDSQTDNGSLLGRQGGSEDGYSSLFARPRSKSGALLTQRKFFREL
jgi:hypothetical protein